MYESGPSAQDLLSCFFNECERHFRFLEQRYHFGYLSGMVEYQRNIKIIKPFRSTNSIPSDVLDFQAVTRYERDEVAVEIGFSKSQLAIEGHVYFDPVLRFELSEILTAAKKHDDGIGGDIGLIQEDMVEDTVSAMATALRQNIQYFVEPSEKLIDRAQVIRNKRIEQAVRQHFAVLLEDTSKEAARAFTNRDYKKVMTLLQPYEPYLGNADLKKLILSRKRLLDHSQQS
jgi:hypothetical protein